MLALVSAGVGQGERGGENEGGGEEGGELHFGGILEGRVLSGVSFPGLKHSSNDMVYEWLNSFSGRLDLQVDRCLHGSKSVTDSE